jgi:tetratricopeptide (TPR) repeat protein
MILSLCTACVLCVASSADQLSDATKHVVDLVERGATIGEVTTAVEARRTAEDAKIRASANLDVQVAAAGESFRAEGRARRSGASARWGVPMPNQRALAASFNARMEKLATTVWTLSINSQDRDTRRRGTTAAGLRAAAMLGTLRDGATSDAWLSETTNLTGLLVDATEFAQSPRGAILFTAAIVAAAQNNLEHAKELLLLARNDPEGIDALEFELIEAAIEDGGVKGRNRLAAAKIVAQRALTPSERLFLAEWQLRAAAEASVPKTTALKAITELLTNASETERRLLTRPFADLVYRSPGNATDHPLDAFGRARAAVASSDVETARSAFATAAEGNLGFLQTEILLERAQVELKAGDFAAAERALLAAIEAEPVHASAPAAASLAVRLSDRTDNTLQTRLKVLALLPNHPDRYAWRLVVAADAYDKHDVARARELWSSIPALVPESVEAAARCLAATLQLPKDRIIEGEPMRLSQRYDDAVEAHPSVVAKARGVVLRVRALHAVGRSNEAGRLAESLLDVAAIPEEVRPEAVAAALEAFEASRRTDEAKRIVQTFADVDPAGQDLFAEVMLKNGAAKVQILLRAGNLREAAVQAKLLIAKAAIPSNTAIREAATTAPWKVIQSALLLRVAERPADALRTITVLLDVQPMAAEALLEKAHALASIGDASSMEAAFSLYKRLRAGAPTQSAMWWQCELGQLQVLKKLGKNVDAIRPRLEWLRSQDPKLGGTATKQGFETLQVSLSR